MSADFKQRCQSSQVGQWSGAIRDRISEAISLYGRCALPFSGGLGSCLLLHLAQPWKDRLVVITLNTGASFAHVEGFIDRALTGWNRKVVSTDVRTYLEDEALPSVLFSLMEKQGLDLGDIRTHGGKRVISSFDCCCRNRGFPGHHAVRDLNIRGLISDQIGANADGTPEDRTLDGVANIAPLRVHTRPEIEEMISALGIAVPDHYPEFDAPHGCSICPTALSPLRQVWMAKLYPDELMAAAAFQAEEVEAVIAAIAQGAANTAKVIPLKITERV